jgi:hypothetical protein
MTVAPAVASAFTAMQALRPPRNAASVQAAWDDGRLTLGGHVAVSLVGDSPLRMPTVYVDPGRRYDLRCCAGLFAFIVTTPGVDTRDVIDQLWPITCPYITLVDVERQVVASVVDRPNGSRKLWPRRRGSEPWLAVFG